MAAKYKKGRDRPRRPAPTEAAPATVHLDEAPALPADSGEAAMVGLRLFAAGCALAGILLSLAAVHPWR